MISRYQESEVLFGSITFFVVYYIYLWATGTSKAIIFDTVYGTFAIAILLYLRAFAVYYYQLQSASA